MLPNALAQTDGAVTELTLGISLMTTSTLSNLGAKHAPSDDL